MSIDVVSLRNFRADEDAIDVAFPVFAIECEINPPLESQLDAYEEAVLKFISIGLSTKGIAHALNITFSLVEQILSELKGKNFITKQVAKHWEITQAGENYLRGLRGKLPSGSGRFGYIFISAIKKDVLQYFYEGSLGKIPRSNFDVVEQPLLLRNEEQTFCGFDSPGRGRIEKAYNSYLRSLELARKQECEEISIQEAQDAYADYESFDEADYEDEDYQNQIEPSKTMNPKIELTSGRKSFVRPLKRPPIKLYLQMRIIITPEEPGGFIVESPLDLNGIDNEFFLRQVQWMKNIKEVSVADENLSKLLDCEVQKLSRCKPIGEKDRSVFILEHLPLLAAEKNRYPTMYEDLADIYSLMGINMSQITRENVVGALNRKLLEVLMNIMLRSVGRNTLQMVKDNSRSYIKAAGEEALIANIVKTARIQRKLLPNDGYFIKVAINKLDGTLGNSIAEKLYNILVVYTYGTSIAIRRFVEQPGFEDCVRTIIRLNQIRNPVSHDTDEVISREDYEFYLENVFGIANRLLESLKEEVING